MDAQELGNRIQGKVVNAADDKYENLRSAINWNQMTPKRYPHLIVQVANEQDVIEVVHFARANRDANRGARQRTQLGDVLASRQNPVGRFGTAETSID